MGILLFKDERHRYEGFNDGMHVFKDLNNESIVLTRTAKLHLSNTPVTLICKDGGEVEPTYQTTRVVNKELLFEILKTHGLNLSLD